MAAADVDGPDMRGMWLNEEAASDEDGGGKLVFTEDGGVRLPAVQQSKLNGEDTLAGSSKSQPGLKSQKKFNGRRLQGTTSLPALSSKQPSARTQKFVERQFNHRSVEMRKQLADMQRYVVQGSRDMDDVEFWGAQGAKGFRTYLDRKFGSILAGWRYLDQDKNGRLSFYEFCNACRRMGYHGNLKKLWQELDSDGSGFVSLVKLDKEVGLWVGTFKLELLKKYGDMLTAWQEGLDVNGTGRVEEAEVTACLGRLGLTHLDGKRLFAMMRSSPGGQGMTLHEFDPDAWVRQVTGDTKGLISKKVSEAEFLMDLPEELMSEVKQLQSGRQVDGARQFRQALREADKEEVKAEKQKVLRLGLHTVKGFKTAVVRRCGSLLGGWREALDLDGNGRITFGEFCQALHRLGFHGDVKGLWSLLGGGERGFIEFSDLDKETDEQLKELTAKLTDHYGNMLLAWIRGMDKHGTGACNEKQFVKVCQEVGFSGDAQALFKLMQPDAARRFLSLRDFDVKAYAALSRGDFRMLSEKAEDAADKKLSELSFQERQEAGFYYQFRRALDVAKREEFSKAVGLANIPEHLVDTQDEFENLCFRKFGNMIGAWRQHLDVDANGRLTFNEFCAGCRRMGYGGNLKELWACYSKGSLHITLKDFDPQAFGVINSFLNRLEEEYGNLDEAWKLGFGKDPHDSIDLEELRSACQALEFSYDAKKLFKCLMPAPGKTQITIWDLDPECTRKRAPGAKVVASTAKNPVSQVRGRSVFGSSQNAAQSPTTHSSLHLDGMSMQEACRKSLRRHYGSTVAAWRIALDPTGTGRATFGSFILAMNECCFHGNVKGLWEEMCSKGDAQKKDEPDAHGSGNSSSKPESVPLQTIGLQDLDPVAAASLNVLRKQLLAQFSSLVEAWHVGMDGDGAGRVDQKEFNAAMTRSSVMLKHPTHVFNLLLTRMGQRSITKEDLQALLITVPSAERPSLWGARAKKTNAAAESSDAALSARGEQGAPSPREHLIALQEAHTRMCKTLSSMEDFKRMLVLKFGSIFSAWRLFLDTDRNGIITHRDFAMACQKLGCTMSKTLWQQLDRDSNGQISLSELDSEVASMLEQLEQLLKEKHESCKEGWKKAIDRDNTIRVDVARFVASLQALGFEGNGEAFFRLLRPEPGRTYLTYEDIWSA